MGLRFVLGIFYISVMLMEVIIIFYFRGTLDEKIHFIFNMYDIGHCNTVSKQEMLTLLNHGGCGVKCAIKILLR